MGFRLSLLLLGLFAPALEAGAQGAGDVAIVQVESGPLPPLHPTMIMGSSKKGPSCQVVGVDGNYAVADNHGAQLRLPSSATYEPARASGFLPGSIEIKGQAASSSQLRRAYRFSGGETIDGGVLSEGSEYQATVVASQAYPACYLVLVFFDPGFLDGSADSASAMVAFQSIGDLPAGVETKVKAYYGFLDARSRSMGYIPLYFSHGGEIRTSLAEESARFFRRIELLRHKRMVDLYFQRNPRATLPARPYLRFPPIFPPGTDRASIPDRLEVDFTVSTDGTVEGVTLSKAVQADVLAGIQRTIQGWLYLPKLQNGQPVESATSLVLNFKGPAQRGGAGAASAPSAK